MIPLSPDESVHLNLSFLFLSFFFVRVLVRTASEGIKVRVRDELGAPHAGFACGAFDLVFPTFLPTDRIDCDAVEKTPTRKTDAWGTLTLVF